MPSADALMDAALLVLRANPARRFVETTSEGWLRHYFPTAITAPFTRAHREFWEWVDSLEAGQRQGPFVAAWPRGYGKSTSAELAVARVAAKRTRFYVLYVSGTQSLADMHVENVGEHLLSPEFARDYPEVADREVNRFGSSLGWRHNRLHTRSGFVVDAAGLDSRIRGKLVGDRRPDLIILDDIDDESDGPIAAASKLNRLLRAILPSRDMQAGAVLAVQNLIYRGSIFDQIVNGDLLPERHLSGPYPALQGMVLRRDHANEPIGVEDWGTPTWEGLDVDACKALVNEIGLEAFLAECQHDLAVQSDRVLPGFDPVIHRWPHEWMPDYHAVLGGLDAGSEGETAHFSAGLIGVVFRFPDDDLETERVLLVGEFKERGQGIAERQETWMLAQEMLWNRADWREDGSQFEGIQYRAKRFSIVPSQKGQGVEGEQIKLIAKLLRQTDPSRVLDHGRPLCYYLSNLTAFEAEALRWRRKPPTTPDGEGRREPVRINDDLMACWRYLAEELDENKGRRVTMRTGKVAKVSMRW